MIRKKIILMCLIGISLLLPAVLFAQPSITLLGVTLNDGFIIDNSDTIIFAFERTMASTDTEISISLPTTACTYHIYKDGAECPVDGITDCTGSLIIPSTDPGSILIINSGEAPGTSLFEVRIEAAFPVVSSDWQVNPIANADIQFTRAIPDIILPYPAQGLSGQPNIPLDATFTTTVFEPSTLVPAPVIDSYSWSQISGPAVTLNGSGTLSPTFNAPTVVIDTDLVFQLTVSDDADSIPGSDDELTAVETVTVTVLAKQEPIDAILLIDTSGSMGWHRTGSINDLEGGCCSRLASAKLAAKYFVDRLGTFAADSRLGVAIFPAEPAPGTNYGDRYTPATDLADVSMFNTIKTDIGGESIVCSDCTTIPVAPGIPTGIPVNWNSTPTQYGLDAARTMLTTAPGSDRTRIIVLFSDGAWNLGSDPADPAYLSGFVADGISIYTIGMGTGADNVNHTSLQDISVTTDIGAAGDPFGFTTYNFGDPASEPNLIPFLEKIMSHMNTLDFSVDPPSSINPKEVKTHKALITGYDSVLSFTLAWESSLKELLHLCVQAPDGTKFYPKESGNGYFNVTLQGRELQKILDNPINIGTWEIQVYNPTKTTLVYNYSVLTKSDLNMKIVLDKEKYHTADTMRIEARLIENNSRLKGAMVIAQITRPEYGIGNWHHEHIVPMDQIMEIPDEMSGEPLSNLDKKNFILLQKEQVKLPPIITEPKLVLNDEGIDGDKYPNDGIYSGLFNDFRAPGIYKFKIIAVGETPKHQKFRREQEVQKYVDLVADIDKTIKKGDIQTIPRTKSGIMTIQVIPFDKFESFLGPGFADKIIIKSSEGKPIIDKNREKEEEIIVEDLLDGIYQQKFFLENADANPRITIIVRGIRIYDGPYLELKNQNEDYERLFK